MIMIISLFPENTSVTIIKDNMKFTDLRGNLVSTEYIYNILTFNPSREVDYKY